MYSWGTIFAYVYNKNLFRICLEPGYSLELDGAERGVARITKRAQGLDYASKLTALRCLITFVGMHLCLAFCYVHTRSFV